MRKLLTFLIENRTLLSYSEIQEATGLSEPEVLKLIREAEVMFNFEPRFHFSEQGRVIMVGSMNLVKQYLGMA